MLLLFFVATGVAVAFMGGVVFTLVVTRPEVGSARRQVDELARRDRKAARA